MPEGQNLQPASQEVKVVNAELVPDAPAGVIKIEGVDGEEIVVAGHLFKPIVLGPKDKDGQTIIIKLSQRERRFIARLLNTGNLALASQDINIDAEAGKRFLKRRAVAQYMDEKLRETALSEDTTLANNLAWLRQVRDGETEATKAQLDAAKTIQRIHKPAPVGRGGVQVNVQQNNGSAAASVPNPYAGLDEATLIAQTEAAINVSKGRCSPTP